MCDDKYQREEVVHEVCGQIVDIHPTHILVHVHVHCITVSNCSHFVSLSHCAGAC